MPDPASIYIPAVIADVLLAEKLSAPTGLRADVLFVFRDERGVPITFQLRHTAAHTLLKRLQAMELEEPE